LETFDTKINVKALRIANGLSQNELAEATGIPRGRINAWEQRGSMPKHEDYLTLMSFFKNETKVSENSNVPYITFPKAQKSEATDLGHELSGYVNKSGNQFIELSEGKFIMNTPLILKKAYAGYMSGWGDEIYINELPVHPIIVDKPHMGEYRSFEVDGESMDDGTAMAIQKGDIVTGRKIDRTFWKSKLHLKKYSEFIIVSLDGIIIKEIISHDTGAETITCHSRNPDKTLFPDFDVSLGKVMQIFNVVQITKKR